MQDERQYFWIDKIRPNNKAVFEFAGLPQDDSDDVEINDNGDTLLSWAENSEVGDEWDTLTERYTRIK